MLSLNELRAAFAAHLYADPLRFSMDKALAHVCQLAYQRGLEDGANDGLLNAQSSTLTDTYIQEVPDKCDRIIWRGHYYHLPLNTAVRQKKDLCGYCGGTMKPGIAIQQTATGSPDFPGGEAVTMSPGGPGRLIDCLKCEACGWSISKAEEQP